MKVFGIGTCGIIKGSDKGHHSYKSYEN